MMFFSKKSVTPGFEKNVLQTVTELDSYDSASGRFETQDIEDAQVICSHLNEEGRPHKPVLDIDFQIWVLPSSTPGHFHLYVDKKVTWDKYEKLLDALADCGIIEEGYARASKERGFTAVRLPWVKKEQKP